MANSPQKRKADAPLDEPTNTVSRSGRVRKPKLFEDCVCPSDMVISKRRSMPNVKTAKAKNPAKPAEPPVVSSPISNENAPPESLEMKPPKTSPKITIPALPKPKAASIGNNRRKTVCVASAFDDSSAVNNGCIVCDRSDAKKGRFVNCIDCIKRGHFTCLRTGKLFKTADQETNWQCPSCKICEYCTKSEPLVSSFSANSTSISY